MPIQHWMTFGTFAEQNYYIYPDKSTYHGIIFNANMTSHAPAGLAGFLTGKADPGIKYLIDPLTHAYQHDISTISSKKKDGTSGIKSPFQSLAEAYGSPINEILGQRPLLSRDLADPEKLKEFTHRVLEYQKNQLSIKMFESELNKKYLNQNEEDLRPYSLIAPYFYMTETSYQEWLPIIVKALQYAKESEDFKDCKIFGGIVLSQGILLENGIVTSILTALNDTGADGFILWIDGLNEHEAGRVELSGLLKLCEGLRKDDRELINLHGGYFSLLAAGGKFRQQYFTGVAHGAEFGESRSVIPVGGGIPIAKYYLRPIHKRVKYGEAINFLNMKGWLHDSNSFHSNVCNCRECKNTLSGNTDNFTLYGRSDSKLIKRGSSVVTIDYPTRDTREHCLKHFLESKKLEYELASNASSEEIINDLQNGFTEFREVTGTEYISYLDIWAKTLTGKGLQ